MASSPDTTAGASETLDASRPVEMNTLGAPSQPSTSVNARDLTQSSHPSSRSETERAAATAATGMPQTATPAESAELAHSPTSLSQPEFAGPVMPKKPSDALGPAIENGAINSASSTEPSLPITLMIASTGARHPYKIDEKYLKARDTVAHASDGSFDPRMISGYKLRELIWTDWRNEWEPRPASPGSIRLIFMGQLVDDKKTLADFRTKLNEPNVIHMSVKPADFGEDDEAGTAKGAKNSSIRQRDGGDGGAGCRCVVV